MAGSCIVRGTEMFLNLRIEVGSHAYGLDGRTCAFESLLQLTFSSVVIRLMVHKTSEVERLVDEMETVGIM